MSYRLKKDEIWFFVLYGLYLFAFLINCTVIRLNPQVLTILEGMRYICYLLAIIKILKSFFSEKQIFISVFLVILIGITALWVGERTLLLFVIIYWAAKDVNCRSIIKITFILQSIILVCIIGLSQTGIIVDTIVDKAIRPRHLLGFEWANTAPTLFFFIIMSYIFLRKERINLFEIIVIEAINAWLFIMTDTKLSFVLLTVALIYVFIMKFYWVNRVDKIKKNRWLVLAPAVICILSILLHWLYREGNVFWDSLNTLLSGRLSLGYNAIDKYGITLFGTDIAWVGLGIGTPSGAIYNYVDCSYVQTLLSRGIIFLAIIIGAYTYVMYKAVKISDFYLQTVLLFVLLHSITEPRLFDISYNVFPMLAIGMWGMNQAGIIRSLAGQKYRNWKIQMPRIRLKKRL